MSGQITHDNIYFTTDPDTTVAEIITELGNPKVLIVADSHTADTCLPLLPSLSGFETVVIEAGEQHKNVETLQQVWKAMICSPLLRSDLLINVGGGVVSDLGGFAAATYMRGIRYINIPTTLLADVDAASGGKTAIDFGGIKNIVGAFHIPEATVISPAPLRTLPRKEFLSGWGEMLKHALLDSVEHLEYLLATEPLSLSDTELLSLIRRSAEVKLRITSQDPKEQGLRRSLNLGHTCGHALEALCMKRGEEIAHGHAVALGLLAELRMNPRFPAELYDRLQTHIRQLYRPVEITERDFPSLHEFLLHDKKNMNGSCGKTAYISMDYPGKADIYAEADADSLCDSLSEVVKF